MVETLCEVRRSYVKLSTIGTKTKSTTFCWRRTSNGASIPLQDPIMEASGNVVSAQSGR